MARTEPVSFMHLLRKSLSQIFEYPNQIEDQ